MITSNSKEGADSPNKQDGNANHGAKVKAPSSSSSPWLRLKDPRIVRVSRAFGGKDRHSKVYTIRGLRDRRVRLSVPTAIQLYDLQDRLGLSQPSKVVDWLLNAAKHEIEELPPLPVPVPGNFAVNNHPMFQITSQEAAAAAAGASQSSKEGLKTSSFNWEDPAGGLSRSSFWSSDAFWRGKSEEVARETNDDKEVKHEGQVSSDHDHNILQRSNNHASLPSSLNTTAVPSSAGSYHHFDPSNFHLPHLGGSHGFAVPQTEEIHNFNVVPLSSGSQILVCPPPGAAATQPFFPPHAAATTSLGIDPRQQVNHFQMLSSGAQNFLLNSLNPPPYSISQSIRPFHLSMTPRLHNNQPEKEHREFPSK